ncbi:MAG: hypothetical protein AB1422_15195, partial [bacterium]
KFEVVEDSVNGRWSPDGKMFIGECFSLYDSTSGKRIGHPLSVGVPSQSGKYFIYKKPNNIW